MLFYTGLIFLIIGVSIDGFGVGITYGMQRIRVPFPALSIIMFCSGLIVYISMTIGNVLRSFITPESAGMTGGIILLFIGLFCLFNVLRSKRDTPFKENPDDETWGNFKTVIKEPHQADLDHSGSISAKEALLLGTALAIDAFGAGLGAAMLGYSPLVTAPSIAFMSGFFVLCGIRLGIFLATKKWMQRLSLLPPLLLIMLGFINML